MRLELGEILIEDIQFAEKSEIKDHVLYVNKEELLEAAKLSETYLESLDFEIAKPGDETRIIPVKDVLEPRVKTEGGKIFPGILNDVDQVGSGVTKCLKGMSVITTGSIVGFQEGIIDMTGEGAKYTPFSKLNNLVVIATVKEGVEQKNHEESVRMVGLRIAEFIGKLAADLECDETKVYETKTIKEIHQLNNGLPNVVYVYMLQTQGLLHDTYVYGVDAKRIIPTFIYPTEVMDGAIVSGNCVSACDKNPTYVHLNNEVIKRLYEEDGKTLNFMGCIITNENVYLADKKRSSDMASKLAQLIGADAAIVSQEGFGNPDTDLIMNCTKLEKKDIKTVLITDEYAGQDGASQSLADADPLATATVTGGNANEVVVLPKIDHIIGDQNAVLVIAGGSDQAILEDGSLRVEVQAITGATNETGFNYLTAKGL